ncbi:MAG: hypothetical protein ABIM89_05215, partial [Mycobacteriales bacterium]
MNDPPPHHNDHHEVDDPTFGAAPEVGVDVRSYGGPASAPVQDVLDRMTRVGTRAADDYLQAVDNVRGQPSEEIVRVVGEALRNLPESEYLSRWGLVQVLNDIAVPGTEAVFRDTIETSMPPERGTGSDYKMPTLAREVLIRMAAVDGLAKLAADGSSEAVDILTANVTNPERNVRLSCIVALNELGGEASELGRARVLEEDRELQDLRRVSVYDVPQPAGG